MIGVGEATGALDTMLGKIADFYEEEVDTAVAGLLTLLEPVMIALLGVVVGGIVIAMYLPIFDLISKLTSGMTADRRSAAATSRWLIAIRVGAQHPAARLGARHRAMTAPGSFAVDPFFLLIGITYALTSSTR